jgi:SPP1 family predicted phage head-tail adaptor
MSIDKSDVALRAGCLTHKVALERRVETQSASGAPIPSWTPVATVWAEVEPMTGKEYLRADQIQAGVQSTCRIRWRDDVVPTMRVVFKGVAYNIQAVLADPRFARHLTLLLESGVSAG